MRRHTSPTRPAHRYLLEPLESRALLSSGPIFVATSPTGGNSAPSIIHPTGHPALVLTGGGATTPIGAGSVGTITTFTRLSAAVENGLTVALIAVIQSSNANSLPTGTVTFRTANGALLATLNVSAFKTTTSNPALGQVSVGLPLALLPAGSQTVIASYNGDALHAVSISNSVALSAVARRLVLGAAPNTAGGVSVIDTTTGRTLRTLNPFPGFTGGIHVAVGDINGDGIPDVVVAPAAGGVPLVRVYDLATGLEIRNFFAFPSAFHGGVNLALGDVNGDGTLDIIAAAGPGGGPGVQVFSGLSNLKIASFFAFNSHFTGGVSIAAGDVTGDGRADIIAAPMSHGGPDVVVFDGLTDVLIRSFFGFTPAFTGGLDVAVTDVNHDGIGEIVTAPRQGPLSQVEVFPDSGNAPLGTFIVNSSFFGGGLNISTFDFNGDGVPDIVVGSASGLFRPEVFNGITRQEIGFLLPSGVLVSNSIFIAGFGG